MNPLLKGLNVSIRLQHLAELFQTAHPILNHFNCGCASLVMRYIATSSSKQRYFPCPSSFQFYVTPSPQLLPLVSFLRKKRLSSTRLLLYSFVLKPFFFTSNVFYPFLFLPIFHICVSKWAILQCFTYLVFDWFRNESRRAYFLHRHNSFPSGSWWVQVHESWLRQSTKIDQRL